jgi:virulence-associated protein VagC
MHRRGWWTAIGMILAGSAQAQLTAPANLTNPNRVNEDIQQRADIEAVNNQRAREQGICLRHMPDRHVKLFKNGRNQAVRIPREFELPGDDAIMRKDGNKLIIEAVPPRSLIALTRDSRAAQRSISADTRRDS